MGDFERVFGAGADVDAIISSFDRDHDYEWHEESDADTDLNSGRELPRAKTAFDLTGQTWRPALTPYCRLEDIDLSKIYLAAKDTLAAIEADPDCDAFVISYGELDKVAKLHAHLCCGLAKIGTSLDHFEAFIGMVVRGSDIDMVFARDTGSNAGYVSPTLSTHIIALPCDVQLLRCGGLQLDGPLWNLMNIGGDYHPGSDSFCVFANTEQGRDVLEVSRSLLNADAGIIHVSDWVKHNRFDSNLSAGKMDPFFGVGFDAVADFVERREQEARTWSDAAEDELRSRVRLLISFLTPPGATATVTLNPNIYGSALSCQISDNCTSKSATVSDTAQTSQADTQELINHILRCFPLSGFRGKARPFPLIKEASFSAYERHRGIGPLLDFLNEIGVDTSAAADALDSGDQRRLIQIISPEIHENMIPF